MGEEEVTSESFEIIVDGYAFTIQKSGKIDGDKEIATPEELPENTGSTESGTRVQLKEGWEQTTQAKTTVYAVSDGEGNTIPIPKGFYYVGGTEETGVVISDSSSDKNKGKDALKGDITKDLVGNQFVWIPCKEEDYHKYNWGDKYKELDASWSETTPTEEKAKVAKYGGFYIARYEAGTSQVTLTNRKKIGQEQLEANNWNNDSYMVSKTTTSSKPTSKANEIPYYCADYETAEKMSERMYNNSNYVSSQLITGTQWDVMLNYISSEENKSIDNAQNEDNYTDLKENCNWGNYYDVNLDECNGKYCVVSNVEGDKRGSIKSLWLDNQDKSNKQEGEDIDWRLLTTASTEKVKKKNLYDISGNLWEWTQEQDTDGLNSVVRGGSYADPCVRSTACSGAVVPCNATSTNYGFRVILYIK